MASPRVLAEHHYERLGPCRSDVIAEPQGRCCAWRRATKVHTRRVMAQRLTPHFADLLYDAALKSYWRKRALRRFLRSCHISESFLATWAEGETKRDFLDRLFAALQQTPQTTRVLVTMARALAEQTTFPDLESWEDSVQKIADAKLAVAALCDALRTLDRDQVNQRERTEARERYRVRQEEAARSQTDLQTLNDRLTALSQRLGTQEAGYQFQDWFYDLMDHQEIDNRRPYKHAGRQIDGSITIAGTTYLVELKFTASPATAADVDSLLKKVGDKADNTMGIMVSISGYSDVAIQQASGPRTPLLLLDHRHIFSVLTGALSFAEVVERVRRHASQTGESYLPAESFGIG